MTTRKESNEGSNALRWWTRSQRIRTEGEVPFEVALSEAEEPPAYQRIAEQAEHLKNLGFCNSKIARYLGMDDKTIAKSLSWRNIE